LGEIKTNRPIHKILSDGNNGLPGCVDVCEKTTVKLLEAGFPRKALGLDGDELDHTQILRVLDDVAVIRKDPNFTKTHRNERVLWCILEDDAQSMAEKILGRRLTLDELRKVKRALEHGLEDWWVVLETAIRDLEG